jgi:hypothetical protein
MEQEDKTYTELKGRTRLSTIFPKDEALQPRTEDIRAQYEDGGDKKSACRGSFL